MFQTEPMKTPTPTLVRDLRLEEVIPNKQLVTHVRQRDEHSTFCRLKFKPKPKFKPPKFRLLSYSLRSEVLSGKAHKSSLIRYNLHLFYARCIRLSRLTNFQQM